MRRIVHIVYLLVISCMLASCSELTYLDIRANNDKLSAEHDRQRAADRLQAKRLKHSADSLFAAGIPAKGQSPAQIRALWGKPDIKTSTYLQGCNKMLHLWIYNHRNTTVEFIDNKVCALSAFPPDKRK